MIETDRLILRPFRSSDAAPAFLIYGDPRVMRAVADGRPDRDLDATRLRVERAVIAAATAKRPLGLFAVERRSDRRLVGDCGLVAFDGGRRVELVVRIAAEAWGEGLGREAGRAILERGFAALGLDTVWARCRSDNAAALTMLRRLGFRPRSLGPDYDDEGETLALDRAAAGRAA